MIDKNQAVINYLACCPQIKNNPLYFNFINAGDNNSQFVTTANDISLNRKYVDGSVKKRYQFTLIVFKSITDAELVRLPEFSNENISDILDIQGIIDWIAEQEEEKNYPDFGESCEIELIETTTDAPRFDGVNAQVTPALAMYSVTIRIDYIDYSKTIWQ